MIRKAIVSTTALLIMTGASAAASPDAKGTKTQAGVTHSDNGNGAEIKSDTAASPGEINMKKGTAATIELPKVTAGSPDSKGTRTQAGVTHSDNGNGAEIKSDTAASPGEVDMKKGTTATIELPKVEGGSPDAKGTRTQAGVTHSDGGNGAEIKSDTAASPGEVDMKKGTTATIELPKVEGGSPDAKGTRTQAGVTHDDSTNTAD